MTRRKTKSLAPVKQTPQAVLDALHAEFEAAEERYRRACEQQRWMASVRARWAAHVDSGVTGSGYSSEDE